MESTMSNLRKLDLVLFGLAFAALVAVLVYAILGLDDEFGAHFAVEDGGIEYATSLFLLISSFVLARYAVRLFKAGRAVSGLFLALYAFLFLFGAGEEVSWTQRMFGFETPETLKDANVQGELTLHNLAWGDTHIAHTIFGTGLAAIITLYLCVLPFLYPRVRWISRLADAFMVPVPSPRHAVGTLAATIVIGFVDLPRQWEVYEFAFSLMVLSVFLYPANARRFAADTAEMETAQTKTPPADRRRFG
jgi:hypothetical protein